MEKRVELNKEMIQALLFHPDWPIMEQFIKQHFDLATDISTIDATNDSSVVHAEVLARKNMNDSIMSLFQSFDLAKKSYNKEKITYE